MAHVLVTGGSGFLGSHIVRELAGAHRVTATFGTHEDRVPPGAQPVSMDLTDDGSIEGAFRAAWPEVVIHTAAITEAKPCEVDPERAKRINVDATAKLARLSQAFGARLIYLSTDQVFAGDAGPYDEDAETSPAQTYGQTKLDGEEAIRRYHRSATVLRVALVYGASPTGDRSASERLLSELRGGGRPRLFNDEYRSPILADDVARAVSDLIPSKEIRLLHLGGPDRISRLGFGQELARAFDLPIEQLDEVSLAEVDIMPARPPDVSLDTRRLVVAVSRAPRSVREGLAFLAEAEGANAGAGGAER